jgi:hypothetical protein
MQMTLPESTSKKLKVYTVRRIVEELYEVTATSREDALNEASIKGDPHTITVIKETVKLSK